MVVVELGGLDTFLHEGRFCLQGRFGIDFTAWRWLDLGCLRSQFLAY